MFRFSGNSFGIPLMVGIVLAAASASAQERRQVPVVRFSSARQDQIDDLVRTKNKENDLRGSVVEVGRSDGTWFRRAYGLREVSPQPLRMRAEDLFDLASLTKAIATVPAVMKLAEQGKISLDDLVSKHLSEFASNGKSGVTIRHLLTHTSGLTADNPLSDYANGETSAVAAIMALPLLSRPGETVRYSDVGFIVLGELVKRLSTKRLGQYGLDEVFGPTGMVDTEFVPSGERRLNAAPTGQIDSVFLRGIVHDPRARALGGEAGHAGLFSTAEDLGRFAKMILSGGVIDGHRVLSMSSVSEMMTPSELTGGTRTTGLMVRRDGSGLWVGHEGFTGTSLWILAQDNLYVTVLSSRLYPDGKGNVHPTVQGLRAAAAAALDMEGREPGLSGRVMTGIDKLRQSDYGILQGAKVGLITNTSGRARDGERTSSLLASAKGVSLRVLFSPEHGLDGRREGAVAPGVDSRTGVPILSLYGPNLEPDDTGLSGIDTIVFDIQDVGTRFYTYLSTMRRAMIVAARRNLRFVVLDRPNPIGGDVVEGPLAGTRNLSFVNYHEIPIRHGMTSGEIAQLLNGELGLGLRLEVVKMTGWDRGMGYEDVGLPWVAPSPNMRKPGQALLYSGIGLLERTNLSVGRGTDTPFEVVGAPWVDERLGEALRAANLDGVDFEAVKFRPSSSIHAGRECVGVRLLVRDRKRFRSVKTGLVIALALVKLYPTEYRSERLNELLANDEVMGMIRKGTEIGEIDRKIGEGTRGFEQRRSRYLLYPL